MSSLLVLYACDCIVFVWTAWEKHMKRYSCDSWPLFSLTAAVVAAEGVMSLALIGLWFSSVLFFVRFGGPLLGPSLLWTFCYFMYMVDYGFRFQLAVMM